VQIQVVTPGEEAAESVKLQEEEVDAALMSIGQLKTKLDELGVDASSCIEKPELVALLEQTTSGAVHKTVQEDLSEIAQDATVAREQAGKKPQDLAAAVQLREDDEEEKDAELKHKEEEKQVEHGQLKTKLDELGVEEEKQVEHGQELLQQAAEDKECGFEAETCEAAMAAQDKPVATVNEELVVAQSLEDREAAAAQEAISVAAAEAAKQMEIASIISNSGEEDVVEGSDGDFVDVKGVLQKEALATLANMGFEDTALSSALLEKTEGNVEQAALQLLSLKQWEQQQEDLREMGFCDAVENSLLLLKHAGRITQVVRDLVQSVEKQE